MLSRRSLKRSCVPWAVFHSYYYHPQLQHSTIHTIDINGHSYRFSYRFAGTNQNNNNNNNSASTDLATMDNNNNGNSNSTNKSSSSNNKKKSAGGKANAKKKTTTKITTATSKKKKTVKSPEEIAAVVAAANESILNKITPQKSEETFSKLLDSFQRLTAPYSDLDELLQDPAVAAISATATEGSAASPASLAKGKKPPTALLTHRTFSSSLTCPKKFYLQQFRPDLAPKTSVGDAVFIDDAAEFGELARRWDRLQFGSKAVLIQEKNFQEAVAHTERVIQNYFDSTYASLGDQAPSLTLHRPAFAAPFVPKHSKLYAEGSSKKGKADAAGAAEQDLYLSDIELRARPCVIRFRPKDNQWVILESMANVDPVSTAARASSTLLRVHFSLLAFRFWITQPHMGIAVRKRFLNLDLDGINAENEKGHLLTDSAQVSAPIDLKRSGILHIRNYFPGPATLMDCDPSRLVRFIQRLSLEELLEVRGKQSVSNPFDIPSNIKLHPKVNQLVGELQVLSGKADKYGPARSSRSLKTRDALQHDVFNKQQEILEALLVYQTAPTLAHQNAPLCGGNGGVNNDEFVCFSADVKDGIAVSSTAGLTAVDEESNGKGKKKAKGGKKSKKEAEETAAAATTATLPTEFPLYSKFVGSHCSRGDTCPFFVEGKCLPQRVDDPLLHKDNHLFTLPSSPVSKKVVWWAEGLRTIKDLLYQHKSGAIKLSAPQLRYVKAVAEGKIGINPKEIETFFSKIRYPCFIIDFEATQFALPPFAKETAYQAVPFQFSLDVFQTDVLTETPKHYDFLHFGKGFSPNEDPRLSCIEELMRIVRLEREKKKEEMTASGELERLVKAEEEALAAEAAANGKRRRKKKAIKITKNNPLEGPVNPYDGCLIAHFASFEKGCLEKLGLLEDKYKDEIKEFFFLDTMELFKKGLVHPNSGGSNSLKKVLPALCPDFQYGVFGGENNHNKDTNNNNNNAATGDQDEQKGENAMGLYRLWYHQESGTTLQDLHQETPAATNLNSPTTTTVAAAAATANDSTSSSSSSTNDLTNSISTTELSSAVDGAANNNNNNTLLSEEMRDRVWTTLRIQLLEYCSLDTRALYEIMRQIWKEKEAVRGVEAEDKSGWIYAVPTIREISF